MHLLEVWNNLAKLRVGHALISYTHYLYIMYLIVFGTFAWNL